jgi:hypothetical protein
MARRSAHTLLSALITALNGQKAREELKLAVEADALVARHGEDAIHLVRNRIVSADRTARKELYRLHDELARRRREPGDPLEGLSI